MLQFVSARTRRPFSAFLVKQADGKVGFEFEAKDPARKGARGAPSAPLRVLGNHPRDRQPIELHSGRYGPYVKHGATNATLPDRDKVESLTLDEAITLVDEKAGRSPARTPRRTAGTRAPRKAVTTAERPVATTTRRTRTAAGNGAAAAKTVVKSLASASRVAARKRATNTPAAKKTAAAVPLSKKTAAKKTGTKRRATPAPATLPRTSAKSTKRAGARTRK